MRATPPNPLGLYDLAGVCHEWCTDWYDDAYYARSPAANPRGPEAGTRRVSRGGAWRHADPWSPVGHRSSLPPALRYSDYGFRLARDRREAQSKGDHLGARAIQRSVTAPPGRSERRGAWGPSRGPHVIITNGRP